MHAAIIIDPHARYDVCFDLSNTADTVLYLNALEEACRARGCPAIFGDGRRSQDYLQSQLGCSSTLQRAYLQISNAAL